MSETLASRPPPPLPTQVTFDPYGETRTCVHVADGVVTATCAAYTPWGTTALLMAGAAVSGAMTVSILVSWLTGAAATAGALFGTIAGSGTVTAVCGAGAVAMIRRGRTATPEARLWFDAERMKVEVHGRSFLDVSRGDVIAAGIGCEPEEDGNSGVRVRLASGREHYFLGGRPVHELERVAALIRQLCGLSWREDGN